MRGLLKLVLALILGLAPAGGGRSQPTTEPSRSSASGHTRSISARRCADRWSSAATAGAGSARSAARRRALAAATATRSGFAFGDQGGFRGRLADGGRTIRGFWVQPSNGRGSFRASLSPRRFRSRGKARTDWRGTATPLDESFTLYLSVFRDADGALTAAFRNPERNSNGGASRFEVSREGDNVRFVVRYDGGEIAHEATLLRDPDRLRIAWPELDRTIELTRRDPAQAPSFFPRGAGRARATSTGGRRRPATAGGPRRRASWGSTRPRWRGPCRASSIPIPPRVRHFDAFDAGRLSRPARARGVFLRPRPRDDARRPLGRQDLLVGDARRGDDAGADLSPETRIYPLMRHLGPFAHPDPRQDEITLAHLLTHSAGLACNDNDEALARQRRHDDGPDGPAELVEIHAGPGDGLRPGDAATLTARRTSTSSAAR